MFIRKLVTFLCLTLYIFNASAALEAVSSATIHGTAPFNIHTVPGKTLGCSVNRPPLISHPGDYVQVGDVVTCMIMYVDKDQDSMKAPFYGVFNQKNTDNADADTYFLFTDANNKKTKLPRSEIVENKMVEDIISDPDFGFEDVMFVTYMIEYTIPNSAIGGKIGLNTAPISQYGLPNIGKIISTDDIYNLSDIYQGTEVTDPWPIRPNTQLKASIWNIKDTQAIPNGYRPKVGTFPLEHASSSAPQLGETYVAVIWYDVNGNGVYDTNENIITDSSQLGGKPFTYQWYLMGNNSAAQGSVTGNKEMLFDGATQDKITLPATNAEAISQWPNLVSLGLPANEAGLQGFNLQINVDY